MQNTKNMLATKNQHPRDLQITFDEGPHIYTINFEDGKKDSGYMSVTTWNHSHFGHFDADAVITNMMKGRNWNPSNKYFDKLRMRLKLAGKRTAMKLRVLERKCITILNVIITRLN